MSNNSNNTKPVLEEVMNYEEDVLASQPDDDVASTELAEKIKIMNQIIESACGKDETDAPKSALTVAISEWSYSENKTRSVLSYSSYKPTINIQKHFEFIQIDLVFASRVDNDMKVIWNHTEKFGQMINGIEGETDNIPFYALTIVPIEFQGKYYISVTNPIFWCLQPTKPGADSNAIRLLFRAENLSIYETDEIDAYEVEANVQRSLLEHERVAEIYEKADEEAARYSEERNKKIEELRRNNQL